jgi:hypothetical protein
MCQSLNNQAISPRLPFLNFFGRYCYPEPEEILMSQAAQLLKKPYNFAEGNISINEPSRLNWKAQMVVIKTPAPELSPKELKSCSLATD